MILVFGGTTEGRLAASILDAAGKPYLYSTVGGMQKIESPHAILIHGALDREHMLRLVDRENVRLIVDAAHPFAGSLHDTIESVSTQRAIPVVRLERRFPPRDTRVVWCGSYEDAVSRMKRDGVRRLLALTGVHTIARLRPFWQRHDTIFRILDRDESCSEAGSYGFPSERLVYYRPGEDDGELIDSVAPDAIITKESGESGGFSAKVDAALSRGLRVYAVMRPVTPGGFVKVEGPVTLRRAVEKLLPDFFPLRSGLTTGTCATAAVTAAMLVLRHSDMPGVVEVCLPGGENVTLEAEIVDVGEDSVTACVVKDAGDDPDVTDGARILARVSLADRESSDIRFTGGEGVGTVTLPGLGPEPGEPAINPVPRRMMSEAVRRIYPSGAVDIEISIPGGRELAEKTFNSRVGVVGGLSVIGTSGVVRPFSNEAFIEAITREIEVAVATRCPRLVLNSGAKSEKSVRAVYPALPPQAFVHYGNAIGESLGIAFRLGVRCLTIGLMIGKAVKLAAGNLDTHSHKVVLDREFLSGLASAAGCSYGAVEKMHGVEMARHIWDMLDVEDADRFFPALLAASARVCRDVYPEGEMEVMIIDDNGNVRYRLK